MSSDPFQEGVEAFQAGDKVRARVLLQQATDLDPNNENAWYYLAAVETESVLRRQYLNRVLQINPSHSRARDVIARMDAAEGITSTPPAPSYSSAPPPPVATYNAPPAAPAVPRVSSTPIRPLDPEGTDTPGADTTSGFILPVTIPGAPAQVSPKSLLNGGWLLFQRGLDVLQRKAGVYETEVGRATWWRFWLLVGFGYTIDAVFSALGLLRFNLLGFILSLILTIPLGIVALYAGIYASHWWAKKQGGQLPLYQHAYAVALPFIPAMVIGSVASAVLSLIGLGGIGALISFVASIYGLYIITLNFETLYGFTDPNQKYFTVAAMFVGFIIAGFVLSAVVGAVFVGTGFALF